MMLEEFREMTSEERLLVVLFCIIAAPAAIGIILGCWLPMIPITQYFFSVIRDWVVK